MTTTFEAKVSAKVWTGVGRDGFVFPELRKDEAEGGIPGLQGKPNFAVCISGGGMRATTLATGWVRTLAHEQILKDARYLISNSGGSWFNAAYSYLPAEHDRVEFLGAYVPPEQLTFERATASGEAPRSYSHAIVNAGLVSGILSNFFMERVQKWINWGKNLFNRMLGRLDDEDDRHFVRFHMWSRSVGQGFLFPFGGDVDGDGKNARVHLQLSYAMAGPETETRAAEASGVTKVLTACRAPEMPYPIIVGAVVVPKDEIQFVPYEFTPQYSGVATLFTSPEGRGQEDGLEEVKGLPEGTTMLGGVLVEPIGANSDAPDGALPASNGPPALMELNRKWNIPLAQAAGISSHFVSQTMVTSANTAAYAGVPTMHVVSSDGSGALMDFADGGGCDNTGVHAALRRGVTKLLVCNANGLTISRTRAQLNEDGEPVLDEDGKPVFVDDDRATFARRFAADVCDVSGLFGGYLDDVPMNQGRTRAQLDEDGKPVLDEDGKPVEGNAVPGSQWNRYMQVLSREKWEEVIDQAFAWSADNSEGKPLMCHVKDVDVVTNRYQGVFNRGEKVEIILLFNTMSDTWKNTVDKVDDGIVGNFAEAHKASGLLGFGETDFPNIKVMKLTYPPELVGYLTNLAAYNMLQILPEVRQLIGGK